MTPTEEAIKAAVDAVAKIICPFEDHSRCKGLPRCDADVLAVRMVRDLQADRSLLLGLLGIDKQYDAVVQLLHLVDGHLGLAVYRGEGNSDRWRKEASALITKIRGQIKALAGDPS